MRKNSVTAVLAAAAAGAVGFVLRRIEVRTALHGGVGIAEENLPVTAILAALSVATVLFSVAFAVLIIKRSGKSGSIYGEAPGAIVTLFGAVLIAFGAGMYYFENKENLTPTAVVFSILALICAASFWFTARPSDDDGGLAKIMCVVPSVFCCLWLVLVYKENSMEPQMIKYVYKCLALAALTMSFYYSSGYFYDRKKPASVTVAGILAIYFSILVLAETSEIWNVLMIAGLALTACVGLVRIVDSVEKE